MNNSRIAFSSEEPVEDLLPKYRAEEARILRIVEAIREVSNTKAWSTLKNEVFDKLVSSLERDLRAEAKKDDPDPKRLNRLSGELKWAEKYSDLSTLEEVYKLDLQRIRTRQNGTPE